MNALLLAGLWLFYQCSRLLIDVETEYDLPL